MSDSSRHSSHEGHHRHHSEHHHSEHHHSSHHHRYTGPRSSQATGLSEEYSVKFSEDDTNLPSVDSLNDKILDREFYDDISRQLEKNMLFEEDLMKGYSGPDDDFSDIEDSFKEDFTKHSGESKYSTQSFENSSENNRSRSSSFDDNRSRSSSFDDNSSRSSSSGSNGSRSSSSGSNSSRNSSSGTSSSGSHSSGNSKKKDSRSGKPQKEHLDSWNRSKKRRKRIITVLLVLVGILFAMIIAFLVLRFKGEMDLKKNVIEEPVVVELPEEAEQEENDENLIVYNGERYWYNEDVITVLCIGVDREAFASPDDMVIGGNGQADADFLVILDKKTGKISFLNISRDTMVDIDRYNMDGQYLDTVKEQLCLSYAFGDGKQTSCENTVLSVSRLLYGMPINAYVAIDFDSIATLNDAVGGVTVPVTEEIADKFPGSPVGSLVTLVGSEAVTYIRTRDTELLDSNNARMSRQKQYIIAFLKTLLQQLKADPTKAVSLFNAVSDKMVTSIKLSEVTYFGTFFAKHGFSEQNMSSVQGEVVMGEDGFAQFIPEEKALFETVLDLFYIKE